MIERIKATATRIWTGHKVHLMVIGSLALALIVGAGVVFVAAGGTAQASPTPSASPSPSQSPSAGPTPYVFVSPSFETAAPTDLPADWAYSDLDGVAAPAEFAHRLPLAVMIADNAVSRPQSGISTASIVIQAYADGGETRYMMIWQEGTATDIGPTRSARPYYVYWAAEYKALYGHVGGDAHSLQKVIPSMSGSIYNMDELNGGSCAYHRISTRAAPQNDYTNSATLLSCAAKRGYPLTYQNMPTRPFADDTPFEQRPASQNITIPYRTGSVSYQYLPASDDYLRIVDGKPEIDPATNGNVYARNIVVMFQAYGYDAGSMDEHNRPWVYNVGSGQATVYLEGKAIPATWKKTSNTALTRFYDSAGKEIPFVRGEIFLQQTTSDAKIVVS